MQHAGAAWRWTNDVWHQFTSYFILVRIGLGDPILIDYGWSLSYWRILKQRVMPSGSVHSSLSGSESMDSERSSSNVDGMKINIGGDSTS